MPMSPREAQERFRTLAELAELAELMKRAQLMRSHPGATEDEIDQLIEAWYAHRPGAEDGDAEGRVIEWPRRP